MRNSRTIIGLLLLLPTLFVLSCAKDGGKCFSNSGTVIVQERAVPDFDSIALYDNVDVILTQDTINRVSVEAGKNIIGGITTQVVNNQLVIHNMNRCNWLRSYDTPINVYVSVRNIWKIRYESAGNITSTNTIRSWYLKIELWGGCGVIDLDVNVNDGFFIQQMGTADLILRGLCKISSVYAGDFGKLQLGGLNTGYSFVKNNGTNDCYVSASKYLDATVGSMGNIYYTGNPDTLYTHITGSGAVIPF